MIPRSLGETLIIALEKSFMPGVAFLDCYNRSVLNNGLSCTITTRVDASSQTYLLEIDE